jgi:hypothetical protein
VEAGLLACRRDSFLALLSIVDPRTLHPSRAAAMMRHLRPSAPSPREGTDPAASPAAGKGDGPSLGPSSGSGSLSPSRPVDGGPGTSWGGAGMGASRSPTVVCRRVGGGYIYQPLGGAGHAGARRPDPELSANDSDSEDGASPAPPVPADEDGASTATAAITALLRAALVLGPDDGLLASGIRPLGVGVPLTLHLSRASPVCFPVFQQGVDSGPVLELSDTNAATDANPFYDSGVIDYYLVAGGAAPPTPFSSRKVLAAAVWCVIRLRAGHLLNLDAPPLPHRASPPCNLHPYAPARTFPW